MADAKLLKRWKITTTLLERARLALPPPSGQQETQRTALLAQYHHFLEHNELELALDKLEEFGHLVDCSGGFWRDLERAAENMGLTEKRPALRKAFSDALERRDSHS